MEISQSKADNKQIFKNIIDLENLLLKGGSADHVMQLAELYKVN